MGYHVYKSFLYITTHINEQCDIHELCHLFILFIREVNENGCKNGT